MMVKMGLSVLEWLEIVESNISGANNDIGIFEEDIEEHLAKFHIDVNVSFFYHFPSYIVVKDIQGATLPDYVIEKIEKEICVEFEKEMTGKRYVFNFVEVEDNDVDNSQY